MARKNSAAEPAKPLVDPRTACLDEINAVLGKYGCDLVAVPQFKSDGRGAWFVVATIALSPRTKPTA